MLAGGIVHFRFDQLGKNILRDFFGLLADAQTEAGGWFG